MTLPEVRRYLDRNPEKRPRGRTLPVNPQAAAKLRRILEEQKEQSIMSNEKQSQGAVTPEHVEQWRQWREEGLSYQAIADRSGFDITFGGVAYHLKKLQKAEKAAAKKAAQTARRRAERAKEQARHDEYHAQSIERGAAQMGALHAADDDSKAATAPTDTSTSRKNGALQPVWFEALDLDDLEDVVTALKAMTTTAALMGGRVHVQLELEV